MSASRHIPDVPPSPVLATTAVRCSTMAHLPLDTAQSGVCAHSSTRNTGLRQYSPLLPYVVLPWRTCRWIRRNLVFVLTAAHATLFDHVVLALENRQILGVLRTMCLHTAVSHDAFHMSVNYLSTPMSELLLQDTMFLNFRFPCLTFQSRAHHPPHHQRILGNGSGARRAAHSYEPRGGRV